MKKQHSTTQNQDPTRNLIAKLTIGIFLLFSQSIFATTYTVVNTNDSGAGSLRDAITTANSNLGADNIVFNIPGAPPYIITLTSLLPITETLEINGMNNGQRVILEGNQMLRVNTPGNTYGSDPTTIMKCLKEAGGTTATTRLGQVAANAPMIQVKGAAAAGTVVQNFVFRISGITPVTGNTTANRNAVLETIGPCVGVHVVEANDVTVHHNQFNNFIVGQSATFVGPVELSTIGTDNFTFSDNECTYPNLDCIETRGTITNSKIINNVGSGLVFALDTSEGFFMGGPAPDPAPISTNNLIDNNKFDGYSFGMSVGGGLRSTLNVVSNNEVYNTHSSPPGFGVGIGIDCASSTFTKNHIHDNDIGILSQRPENKISKNRIHDNLSSGVMVFGPGIGNSILQNSIYDNGGLGITLTNSFPPPLTAVPNDVGDADTGPNNFQNYPVLQAAGSFINPEKAKVKGSLDSKANQEYLVQIFANAVGDPSNHGEGQVFIGETLVTTNNKGHANFEFMADAHSPAVRDPDTGICGPAPILTATATDKITGDTSEFSQWVAVNVKGSANAYRTRCDND